MNFCHNETIARDVSIYLTKIQTDSLGILTDEFLKGRNRS